MANARPYAMAATSKSQEYQRKAKRERRTGLSVVSGGVAIRDAFQKFRLGVIAQLGSAQTPKFRELSRPNVKKPGNGSNAFRPVGAKLARDER
jgi:hypothetical protein